MKTIKIMCLLAAVVLAGLFGCARNTAENQNGTEPTKAETVDKQAPEAEDETQNDPEAGKTPDAETEPKNNGESEKTSDGRDIRKGSGSYNGQIDNNFIEMQVDGNPKVFMLSQELKADFAALELETGETVTFAYYVNPVGEKEQNVLVRMERAPEQG